MASDMVRVRSRRIRDRQMGLPMSDATEPDVFTRLPLEIDEHGSVWAANGDGIICPDGPRGEPCIDSGWAELIVARVNGWDDLIQRTKRAELDRLIARLADCAQRVVAGPFPGQLWRDGVNDEDYQRMCGAAADLNAHRAKMPHATAGE